MAAFEELLVRAQRVYMYAGFAAAVDTTDQVAAGMQSQAGSMFGQVASAAAFVRPELLSIGRAKLDEWMKQDSKLAATLISSMICSEKKIMFAPAKWKNCSVCWRFR